MAAKVNVKPRQRTRIATMYVIEKIMKGLSDLSLTDFIRVLEISYDKDIVVLKPFGKDSYEISLKEFTESYETV